MAGEIPVLSSLSLSWLITHISGKDACALLVDKWAAEQLESTWPGLTAVGDMNVPLLSSYRASLSTHTGYSPNGQAAPQRRCLGNTRVLNPGMEWKQYLTFRGCRTARIGMFQPGPSRYQCLHVQGWSHCSWTLWLQMSLIRDCPRRMTRWRLRSQAQG